MTQRPKRVSRTEYGWSIRVSDAATGREYRAPAQSLAQRVTGRLRDGWYLSLNVLRDPPSHSAAAKHAADEGWRR